MKTSILKERTFSPAQGELSATAGTLTPADRQKLTTQSFREGFKTMGSNLKHPANPIKGPKDEAAISALIAQSTQKAGGLGKRKKTADNAVSVHVMKLEDLPEPLSMREFREICMREGIPFQQGNLSVPGLSGELFELSKEMQQRRAQKKWNNTVSNLFGAYLAVYDLFKNWHSGIIMERHIGPDSVEQHVQSTKPRPPFLGEPKPIMTTKEKIHFKRQQKLVNTLIQYGIGLGVEASKVPALDHRPGTKQSHRADPYSYNSGGARYGSPQLSNNYLYGPTVDQRMVVETLGQKIKTAQGHYPSAQKSGAGESLQVPMANSIPMVDSKRKRYSFAVSDDSHSNFNGPGGSSTGHNSVLVEVDIAVHGNKDYEHFDPQDEIQISQYAAERMKLIDEPPEGLSRSKLTSSKTLRFQKGVTRKYASRMELEGLGGSTGNLLSGSKQRLTERDLNNDQEFFSPMHKRLRKELIEARQQIDKLKTDLEQSQRRQVQTISKFRQEEVARSVHSKMLQMPYHEQAETIKNQIESRFYSVQDGLEPHIVQILNEKLAQIKEFFIGQVKLISHHTDSLRQNVALMENINKEGIKFSEMDTEKLISLISKIEELKRDQNQELRTLDPTSKSRPDMNRPLCIWQWLQQYFGADYFLEVIEEEYGIAPGANEYFAQQIQRHFDSQVTAYTVEQSNMSKHFEDAIDTLKQEVTRLTEDNTRLMRTEQKQIDKIMQDLRVNINMLAKNQEEARVKAYKAKLQQAQETIMEQNRQRDEGIPFSWKTLQKKWAIKRRQLFWILNKVIRQIKEEKRTNIDGKMLKLCQKFFYEEYIYVKYQYEEDVPVQLIKDQLHQDKKLKWKRKYEESQDFLGHFENRTNELDMQAQQYRDEIERLTQENLELRLRIPALEEQTQLYEKVIVMKEKENKELYEKVKNIENRWKNNTKEPHKFTAKPILSALELKSLNEMSAHLTREARLLMRTQRQRKVQSTVTTMCNIRVPIEIIKKKERGDIEDKDTQTDPKIIYSQETQTQASVFQVAEVACGKNTSMRLRTIGVTTEGDNFTIGVESTRPYQELNYVGKQASEIPAALASNMNRRQSIVKGSFSKPAIKKAQSTVLSQQEFQFGAQARQNNQSNGAIVRCQQTLSGGTNPNPAANEDTRSQHTSQQESASKAPISRRNTIHNMKNSAKRRHQLSQQQFNDKRNNDLKGIRKSFVAGGGRVPDYSEASPSLDREDRSSLLQRGYTIDGFTGPGHVTQDKDSLLTKSAAVLPNQLDKKGSDRRLLRQTVAGANSTGSKGSGTDFKANANLRRTHRVGQKDGEAGALSSPKALLKPTKGGNAANNLSTIKSPDKLNISANNGRVHARKTLNSKNSTLGINRRAKDVSMRLTSAHQKSNLDTVQPRHSLAKYHSKRELVNPSALKKNESQFKQSGRKQGSTFVKRSNERLNDPHSKPQGAKNNANNQTQGQINARNAGAQSLKKDGLSPNGTKVNAAGHQSCMSPQSQTQVEEVEFENLDITRGQKFPKLMINSFQEQKTGQVASPLHLNSSMKSIADFATSQQLRERADSGQNLASIEDMSPSMPREANPPTIVTETFEAVQNAESRGQNGDRPTTVRDTSKDNSISSRPTALQQDASHHFSHLQQYGRDKSKSLEDICSSNSDDPNNLRQKHATFGQSSNRRHKKNLSSSVAGGINKHSSDINIANELMKLGETEGSVHFQALAQTVKGKSHLFFGATQAGLLNAANSKRLTNVREMDDEYPNVRDSSSRVSEVNRFLKRKTSENYKSEASNRSKSSLKSVQHQSLVEFHNQAVQQIYQNKDDAKSTRQISRSKSGLSQSRPHDLSKSSHKESSSKGQAHVINPIELRNDHLDIARYSKAKSFETDDDTSEYSRSYRGTGKYSKSRASKRLTGAKTVDNKRSSGIASPSDLINAQQFQPSQPNQPISEVQRLMDEQQDRIQKDPLLTKQTRIQKLLLKGYINEEQYLCLTLLEKGYVPVAGDSSPAAKSYRMSLHENFPAPSESHANQGHDHRPSHSPSQQTALRYEHEKALWLSQGGPSYNPHAANTFSSGFYSRPSRQVASSSASPTPLSRSPQSKKRVSKAFIENTYRIYPNKSHVLEKILDRVYSKKKSIGVQCAPPGFSDPVSENEQEASSAFVQTRLQHGSATVGHKDASKTNMLHQRLRRANHNNAQQPHRVLSSSNKKHGSAQVHINRAKVGQKQLTQSQFQFNSLRPASTQQHPSNEAVLPHHALPTVGSQSRFATTQKNPLQKSAEVFSEREPASRLWIKSIHADSLPEFSNQTTTAQQHPKRAQRVHKLTKPGGNHQNQLKILENKFDQQMANSVRGLAPSSLTTRSVYKPPDGLTVQTLSPEVMAFTVSRPHNLIVAGGSLTASSGAGRSGRHTAQGLASNTSASGMYKMGDLRGQHAATSIGQPGQNSYATAQQIVQSVVGGGSRSPPIEGVQGVNSHQSAQKPRS